MRRREQFHPLFADALGLVALQHALAVGDQLVAQRLAIVGDDKAADLVGDLSIVIGVGIQHRILHHPAVRGDVGHDRWRAALQRFHRREAEAFGIGREDEALCAAIERLDLDEGQVLDVQQFALEEARLHRLEDFLIAPGRLAADHQLEVRARRCISRAPTHE